MVKIEYDNMKNKCYKLLNQNMTTQYGCHAPAIGEWNTVKGKLELCRNGFHVYDHPLLAVLMNPIHASYKRPRCFFCQWRGRKITDGTKAAVRSYRIIEEVKLPKVTQIQRRRFGILAAKAVCRNRKWNEWADKWLSGKNRGRKAADVAHVVIETVLYRTEIEVRRTALWAALWATERDTEWAAVEATRSRPNLNLLKIAKKAMQGDS